jgi:hypothetical protein
MTNFDDDLRTRLARIEAAMPTPAAPVLRVGTRRGPNRRRQGLMLLVAATVFLSAAAIATVASQPDTRAVDEAQRMVEQGQVDRALDGAFADACLSVDKATAAIRERLEAAGMRGWTIRAGADTAQATCVTGAYSGDPKEILLMPSMGGPLAKAVEGLRADMRASCYDRDAAVAMVQAVLDANGQAGRPIEVRGISQMPLDGGDEYVAHIKGGCYVFETSQWDDQGRRTFFIAGP